MRLVVVALSCFLFACSNSKNPAQNLSSDNSSKLYALDAVEHEVQFEALYRSQAGEVLQIDPESLPRETSRTTEFLFGPLTYRELAGPQKGETVEPHLDQASVQDGHVMIPYTYKATWLIRRKAVQNGEMKLPVPFTQSDLYTEKWLRCTDPNPEHQTESFYWYFWDPTRWGCDHVAGTHYQEVTVKVGTETAQTTLSFPEYSRMVRMIDGVPTVSMTFAFGYVHDAFSPNPLIDADEGANQFRQFQTYVQTALLPLGFVATPITQAEYFEGGSGYMGTRFEGLKSGVKMKISVVMAAGVDQMNLFARSFAKDHEGFFGWFGHSRVGSGFDAIRFQQIVRNDPETFTVTPDYQLVYWAGCNSYSYYTLPFFEMKANLNSSEDPKGTKNLDIISNTLPSLFSFNTPNAQVVFQALLNWEVPTSYQAIVNSIEVYAQTHHSPVLVNVLGDEDNRNQ